jgi:superfamily II DNA or RNA helicase
MTASTAAPGLPREGMMATLRNRRALITRVRPYGTPTLHAVDVEYTDVEGKAQDTVIWEREVGASLVESGALPDILDKPPMAHDDFEALVRASRWTALTPFLAADGSAQRAELPIASPFHGAVQVEDFQLEPLLRALQMPRISLLLADDVGLGKTIEAGLILTELLLRRRIRRVLILTPAALRDQWQQEMHDKFSLAFDVVDRQETHRLRKQLGLDANPWRTFPRVVSSYHYLRQHDVLEQFLSTCRQHDGAAQLPWDLLIVDEAHNLTPAPFGEDSDLVKMLRAITPYFEHRLFLTATPHNGHTRSFSGLLELLDPVRFHQTPDLSAAERARVQQVLVRRLKRDINEDDDESGRTRRFPERHLDARPLFFGKRERALSLAFGAFRSAVKSAVARSKKSEQLAGSFAVEVLNKRLLSCPRTFADSWYRFIDGVKNDEQASQAELFVAQRAQAEELDDDLEKEGRERHAARTAGAWLKPLAGELRAEIEQVTQALAALGLVYDAALDQVTDPVDDARFDQLVELVKERLRRGNRSWLDDERIIVFTEYKTTLDYVSRRLRATFGVGADERDTGAVRVLFGGMDHKERKAIRVAFNDPDDAVRVLIATDAASEGLNLQETARLLLHWEVPWNPSRLEQRNGRIDRHGQARDVTILHFTSEDDADLKFLGRVVEKVEQIREDLGAVGEVFDAAFQRRFADDEDADSVFGQLDHAVDSGRKAAELPLAPRRRKREEDEARLERLCSDIDLSPQSLHDTLDVALGLGVPRPRLEGPDARGRFRVKLDGLPPAWRGLLDDHLRLGDDAPAALVGAMPGVVFDAMHFIVDKAGRPVFRPAADTALLHLGHPVFRQALARFARERFPGAASHGATRWSVTRGPVPDGVDALLLVTVEELAINELREPFHHWVRTLRIPARDGALGDELAYVAPAAHRATRPGDKNDVVAARALWEDVRGELRQRLRTRTDRLRNELERALELGRVQAIAEADAALTARIDEVKASMERTSIRQLERERADLEKRSRQIQLFAADQRELERQLVNLEEERERRLHRAGDLVKLLEREKKRIVGELVPARHRVGAGGIQLFPLTVEIRLPEVR